MRRIVPVFPWPMHPAVAEVLEAIEDINLVEALPGGPGPILAIGKAPTFMCDALVVTKPQSVAEAVKVIIGDGIELMTVRDMVGKAIGADADIQEWADKVESKVKFR